MSAASLHRFAIGLFAMEVDWDKFRDGWASGSMVCERCGKVFKGVRFRYSCHDKVEGDWPKCCDRLTKFRNDWSPESEVVSR